MRKKILVWISVVTTLLAAIATVKPTVASGQCSMYVTPVINGPGDFSVDIMIDNVLYLFGYEFQLLFNPNILEATSISVGNFFPTPPGYVVWVKEVGPGYAWLAVTRPGISWVSGSGRLGTVYFTVVGSGACYIELANTLLSDPFGYPIEHEALWGYYSDFAPTLQADLVKRRDMVRPEHYEFAFSKELAKGEDLIQTLYAGAENLGTVPVRVGVVFTLTDERGNVYYATALGVIGPTTPGKPASLKVDWEAKLGTYACQVDLWYDIDGDGTLDEEAHGETVRSFEFVVVENPIE